ncbi:MAG TPA: cyclic nucleotide-binding domain-containing protein [Anaerolineales bacterium]
MPENPVRVEFLKRLHLFHGLNDNDLAAVAEELQELVFEKDSLVFAEGTAADSLHIIFKGQVNTTRLVNKQPVPVASLSRADYYGEEGLLRAKARTLTANAEGGTELLVLYRAALARLLKKIPGLRQNFELMMTSRRLVQELNFDWLIKNEIIYFLGRKHKVLLIIAILVPALLLLPLLAALGLAYALSSASIGLVGGFLLVIDLAWAAWRIIDWGNDYYIVTNQRVIWLEKVVAFYDSRTEAGMGTILSVNFETDYLGRMFSYGIVVVRTYTGEIRMEYVDHPKKVVAVVEEFVARAKESGRKANEDSMKQAIRTRLGFAQPGAQPAAAHLPAVINPASPAKPAVKASALEVWWKNAFRMRTEDGNTITYHKHIFGFVRDTFLYVLGIFGLVILVVIWPVIAGFSLPLWVGSLIGVAMLVLFGAIGYQYLDWQNDIYQVTPEQIVDVTRKPFGTEKRDAAPLENILSTENKRNGLLGVLLNFGTVYIMVGSKEFNFDDVADPPSVQQDIIRRQQGLLQKKREKDNASERDRMTEWLAMYHRTMDDVNREKNQSGQQNSE